MSKSSTCPIYKNVGKGHYGSLVPVSPDFSMEELLNLKHMNIVKSYFLLELRQKFLVTEQVSTLDVFFEELEESYKTKNGKKGDDNWWDYIAASDFQRIMSQAVSALVWLKSKQMKIDRNMEKCIFVNEDKNGLIMPSFDESEGGEFSSLFEIVKKHLGEYYSFPPELQDIYNPYPNNTNKELDELLLFHPLFWGTYQKLTFMKKVHSLKKTYNQLWTKMEEIMDKDPSAGSFWQEVMGDDNTNNSICKKIYKHSGHPIDEYKKDFQPIYTKRSQIISYMRNCLTHYNDHAPKPEENVEKLLSTLFPWAYTEVFRTLFTVVESQSTGKWQQQNMLKQVRGVLRQMYYCGEYST